MVKTKLVDHLSSNIQLVIQLCLKIWLTICRQMTVGYTIMVKKKLVDHLSSNVQLVIQLW
jgi:hypothetical protein